MARIPAGVAKSRAQVDQCVTGQLLFSERPGDAKDFVRTGKGTVRLLVAKRPASRHMGPAGEIRVFFEHLRRPLAQKQEDVPG